MHRIRLAARACHRFLMRAAGAAARARAADRIKDLATVRRRAQQPAGRLRPGGRARWHRRPDDAGALHDAEHREHAAALRRHDSGHHQPAAEERRSGDGDRRPAAVRQGRPDHRRHVGTIGNASSLRGGDLLHDAAARRRRRGLRDGAGQRRWSAASASRARTARACRVNVPSSGRVPNGATVEREVPIDFATDPLRDAQSQYPGFHHRART